MTKPKPRPARAVDAVQTALEKERKRRGASLKPIEIVKLAISEYQKYVSQGESAAGSLAVESDDRAGLRRGTQASVDRLLFNANYWCAAYEDRIVAACSNPDDARACLKAASVWTSHALKLNTLSDEDVVATFERFCPPFAVNKRHGSDAGAAAGNAGAGKGPVADFKKCALAVAEHESDANAAALRKVVADMEAEARAYEGIGAGEPLDAFFEILPAWCLQDRIDLVRGSWWDDVSVMSFVVGRLAEQFAARGFGEPLCQYYLDSCSEVIDAYQREITTEPSSLASLSVSELVDIVHSARQSHPDSESDGYGSSLPGWLIYKEQLIWNTVVCAVYGPAAARPLLVDSPSLLADADYTSRTDVITELAQTSYKRYVSDRASSSVENEFASYAEQPIDLRNSGIEHIRSIPDKLAVLGYDIMPAGSCYPDQRIVTLTPSEVECLAILEHRRWLRERTAAGWVYARIKDINAKKSPYIVPWEDLPDRAREWNRSAVRNIPNLLAGVGLAIVRK